MFAAQIRWRSFVFKHILKARFARCFYPECREEVAGCCLMRLLDNIKKEKLMCFFFRSQELPYVYAHDPRHKQKRAHTRKWCKNVKYGCPSTTILSDTPRPRPLPPA